MNASLPAALLIVLVSLWLLGRSRPRTILRSTDAAAVAALNRAQIERRQEMPPPAPLSPGNPGPRSAEPGEPLTLTPAGGRLEPFPTDAHGRLRLQRQLDLWCSGSREQRLAALVIAGRWRDRCMLPQVRRALRDPDPTVMAAAAAAMEAFRGRSAGAAG